MQFILTQEEMDILKSRVDKTVVAALQSTIDQLRVIHVEKHGCIHLYYPNPGKDPEIEKKNVRYCDDCTLANIKDACSKSKNFSQ
jgi:hypothetical protein